MFGGGERGRGGGFNKMFGGERKRRRIY